MSGTEATNWRRDNEKVETAKGQGGTAFVNSAITVFRNLLFVDGWMDRGNGNDVRDGLGGREA